MTNISERVIKVIAEQCCIDASNIKLESTFTDDLKCDSLDFVEILMALEEEFEIAIPDDAADTVHTVSDVIRILT